MPSNTPKRVNDYVAQTIHEEPETGTLRKSEQ